MFFFFFLYWLFLLWIGDLVYIGGCTALSSRHGGRSPAQLLIRARKIASQTHLSLSRATDSVEGERHHLNTNLAIRMRDRTERGVDILGPRNLPWMAGKNKDRTPRRMFLGVKNRLVPSRDVKIRQERITAGKNLSWARVLPSRCHQISSRRQDGHIARPLIRERLQASRRIVG